jgi:hypothetical protein
MAFMIRPTPSSKVLLIGDRHAEADTSAGTPVRRYRLARLRFDSRPAAWDARFEHLKRVYE